MPIVFRSDRETSIGSGVIAYLWDPADGTLNGTFALALYEGELATETATKASGEPSVLAGTYDVTTFEPNKDVFATGTLKLDPLGTQGVYVVKWRLSPTADVLASLGLVPDTAFEYTALGMSVAGSNVLVVGWDNNVYTRVWAASGITYHEWGQRIVTQGRQRSLRAR